MLSLRQDGRLSVLRLLVAANVVIFLLGSLLTPMGHIRVDGLFGLSSRGISGGMLWQFLTYQFLHASIFHLLVNMLGLWFAGRILENLLGGWRFLLFYLSCGIAGGILQLVVSPGPILIGASGAVCGVIAAFSALYPEMPITALLFFVVPVRMRAKWLGRIIVILSAFLILTRLMGNVGNAAHLGGALAGYAIVWLGRRRAMRQ
ncbi:MAG: rhomboid family intramembrane serine protease [Verrucomicrobia bacterium]|nr:rhomboid family intramembrane serine protease [Verrucomicrobiota bacterium]